MLPQLLVAAAAPALIEQVGKTVRAYLKRREEREARAQSAEVHEIRAQVQQLERDSIQALGHLRTRIEQLEIRRRSR